MLTMFIIIVPQDKRSIDGNLTTILKNLMFLLLAERLENFSYVLPMATLYH